MRFHTNRCAIPDRRVRVRALDACFGILVYAASRHVTLATGSRLAGCVSAAAMLNPNLLYLHATPMTEPMLLATTFLALLWLAEWVVENRDDVPTPLGIGPVRGGVDAL